MPELRQLALNDIDEPSEPMRFSMDEEKMAELCESMAQNGLLQPIGVKPVGERFEIEFGHRRYIAAGRLRWAAIPSLVFKPEEIASGAAMLAENIEREDTTDAEQAIMFASAREKYSLDEAGLVKMFKKSADYIGDRLALLRNDPEVFKALGERKINYSVARELNKIKDETMRRYYLDAAMRGGTNARTVMSWRQQFEAQPAPDATVAPQPLAPAEDSSAPSPQMACFLCGGHKDPWNLVSVYIHNHEMSHIQKMLREAAEAS